MKVGDKIRVINEDGGHGFMMGEILTVTWVDVNNDWPLVVARHDDGRCGTAFTSRFKVVGSAKEKEKSTLQQITEVITGINETYLSESKSSQEQFLVSTNGDYIIVSLGDSEVVWSSENDFFESEEALEKILKSVLIDKARFYQAVAAEIVLG